MAGLCWSRTPWRGQGWLMGSYLGNQEDQKNLSAASQTRAIQVWEKTKSGAQVAVIQSFKTCIYGIWFMAIQRPWIIGDVWRRDIAIVYRVGSLPFFPSLAMFWQNPWNSITTYLYFVLTVPQWYAVGARPVWWRHVITVCIQKYSKLKPNGLWQDKNMLGQNGKIKNTTGGCVVPAWSTRGNTKNMPWKCRRKSELRRGKSIFTITIHHPETIKRNSTSFDVIPIQSRLGFSWQIKGLWICDYLICWTIFAGILWCPWWMDA